MVVSSEKWLEEFKQNSKQTFDTLQFPNAKDEEWRYINYSFLKELQQINLDGNAKISFKLETKSSEIIAARIAESIRMSQEYLGKIIQANEDKFLAAHYANISDGLFLFLPKNSSANISVDISANNSSAHNVIVLEEGSKLNYFENYSDAKDFLVDGTEIFAAENSSINFFSFQNLPQDVFHLSYKKASLKRYAACNWNFGCFGGKFSRYKIETSFEGEGSHSENVGIFFGSKNQHIDINTIAHHIVPHTTNNILARGVMKDSSSSVYRGLIRIEKAAQKSDSYLANHTLLLSPKAFANSIPSLQIEANDVRATHGATVGQIDKDQLFYLTARGLSEKEAENLIVKGFFEPVIQKTVDEEMKNNFEKAIDERLSE
jgi:Fe-S cluster assembly protein SufD